MKDITNYSRAELEELIDQWVICRRNCERDRTILKRALFDGTPQERLAEEFDMSPRQIQNIIYKTQELLFKHL